MLEFLNHQDGQYALNVLNLPTRNAFVAVPVRGFRQRGADLQQKPREWLQRGDTLKQPRGARLQVVVQ